MSSRENLKREMTQIYVYAASQALCELSQQYWDKNKLNSPRQFFSLDLQSQSRCHIMAVRS